MVVTNQIWLLNIESVVHNEVCFNCKTHTEYLDLVRKKE